MLDIRVPGGLIRNKLQSSSSPFSVAFSPKPIIGSNILNRQNPETSSKLEVSQARHQSKRHVNGDNHQDIVTLTIRG